MKQGTRVRRVVLTAATGLLAVACATTSTTPPTATTPSASTTAPTATAIGPVFTMQGVYDVFTTNGTLSAGAQCHASNVGPDAVISAGTPVTVYDQNGHVIASGALETGQYVAVAEGVCKFPFTIAGVPDGFVSYSVEIGSQGVQQVLSGEAHSGVFLTNGV
jgi:hypothetical protein